MWKYFIFFVLLLLDTILSLIAAEVFDFLSHSSPSMLISIFIIVIKLIFGIYIFITLNYLFSAKSCNVFCFYMTKILVHNLLFYRVKNCLIFHLLSDSCTCYWSLNKYLWSAYHVSAIILGAWDTSVNMLGKNSFFCDIYRPLAR